ncbi:MAG: DinB family protein [Planctomycetota bacterium]
MHHHRIWVNAKLLTAAASLSDAQRRRGFAIGQGSVWQTLLHLLGAEYVWLETILGNEDPMMPGDVPNELVGNQMAGNGIRNMGMLRDQWTKLDARWNEYLANLTSDQLLAPITKVSTSSHMGQRTATTLMDVLLHVCTHAHYTTAQLINMLRQLEATNLPDPMLITMARDET